MAKVTLSVRDSHLKEIGKVAKAAEKAGLKVDQTLETVGVITGSIDSKKLRALRQIPGISDVEEEATFQLAPPEGPVQ